MSNDEITLSVDKFAEAFVRVQKKVKKERDKYKDIYA
jgi:hypothetical protein